MIILDKLEKIAQKELGVVTLDTRMNDNLDFYDIGIWSIKRALEEAYALGRKEDK